MLRRFAVEMMVVIMVGAVNNAQHVLQLKGSSLMVRSNAVNGNGHETNATTALY